jgi:uncharacterized protein
MYHFVLQYVLFFFILCFIGWVLELFLEALAGRGFVNRGFFYGPFLPIYALGFTFSYMVVFPFKDYPILVFAVSCVICTLMEAVTGWFLEKFLRVRAWDYNMHPFTFWCNYKGRLSFTSTLTFGLLTVVTLYSVYGFVFRSIDALDMRVLFIIDAVLLAVFACDAFFSFRKYIRNKRSGIISITNGMERTYDITGLFNRFSRDIVNTDIFCQSKKYIQHGAVSVYEHSIEVAKICVKFSLFWPVRDPKALVRAALLHDFFLYDWHDERKLSHGFTHPVVAAENARTYFNISEKEYSLIRTHMWPFTLLHPPCYKEGWILCLSDKIASIKETLYITKPCKQPIPVKHKHHKKAGGTSAQRKYA